MPRKTQFATVEPAPESAPIEAAPPIEAESVGLPIVIAKGNFKRTVYVNPDELPDASRNAIVRIGFRNMPAPDHWSESDGQITATVKSVELKTAGLSSILNDAHASVKFGKETGLALEKLWADANALVDKKLEALSDGKLRSHSGRITDALMQRCMIIARGRVVARAAKAGDKLGHAEITEQAKQMIRENKWITDTAEAQLALEAAMPAD